MQRGVESLFRYVRFAALPGMRGMRRWPDFGARRRVP
jgi:hypothetical protein